jgi:predicted ester cyclase
MSTTAATTITSLDGFHATPTAQRADELARALFEAVNADDPARTDAVLARSFLSYDMHATRSRTGLRRYYSDLRRSFPDLRFQVHENIGVLVEGDLVALRTIITGTHTGHYAGVAPTGRPVQTSASHIFRVRDDQFTSTGRSPTPTASWPPSAPFPVWRTSSRSRSSACPNRQAGCSPSGQEPISADPPDDV